MSQEWHETRYGIFWQRLSPQTIITRYGQVGPYEAEVGERRSPAFASWDMARAWAGWEVQSIETEPA